MDKIALNSTEEIQKRTAKLLYPLFLGQFFGFILTAATFIVVTRMLGPGDYGIYVFAFGFYGLVNAFAAFGVGAYFNRQLAKLEYKKDGEGMLRELSAGCAIVIVLGTLLSLLGISISGYVAGMFPMVGIQPVTLMLASGLIVFLMVNTAEVNALIGLARADLASISNIIVDVVQLVLSVVLIIMYGVNGALAAMLIGYIVGVAVSSYFLYVAVSKYIKFRIRIPSKQEIRDVLRFAMPLAANNFLNTGMQNFSILLLGWFVTTTALGNYGAANKGLALLAMIYGSLGAGMITVFTNATSIKKPEEVNRTYNRIIKLAMILTLPMITFIGVMAEPGMYLLVSGSYTTAPFYLTLIAIGTMIGIFGAYTSTLLVSGSHTRSVLYVNFISALAQLVLLVALVPFIPGIEAKVIGAIIAIFFVGNAVEAVMFAYEVRKKFGLTVQYKRIGLTYLSNIALGVLLFAWLVSSTSYLQPYSPMIRYIVQLAVAFAISAIAYPLILILFQVVNYNDVKIMKSEARMLGRAGSALYGFFVYFEYLYVKVVGVT